MHTHLKHDGKQQVRAGGRASKRRPALPFMPVAMVPLTKGSSSSITGMKTFSLYVIRVLLSSYDKDEEISLETIWVMRYIERADRANIFPSLSIYLSFFWSRHKTLLGQGT